VGRKANNDAVSKCIENFYYSIKGLKLAIFYLGNLLLTNPNSLSQLALSKLPVNPHSDNLSCNFRLIEFNSIGLRELPVTQLFLQVILNPC